MAATQEVTNLQTLARKLRIHSLRATAEAGSGHPTSCLSAAEHGFCAVFSLRCALIRRIPLHPHNDRFVLSKGHAAPVLYAALAEAGVWPVEQLLTLRKMTSDLEGHPTPRIPWVGAATGSLGQGLSVGVGHGTQREISGEERLPCVCAAGRR